MGCIKCGSPNLFPNCGCKDSYLTTIPNPSSTPPCITPNPCSQIFLTDCITYTGTPSVPLNITTGEALTSVIQSIITGITGSLGVTSVGLSLPSIFMVTGSPVTSTGTLTATLNTQSTNTFFAGPVSGSAATPTFRTLSITDLPVGTGTVTNFSSGNLSPLFTTSVSTSTTTPSLLFTAVSQSQNLFYASPNGSSGVPTFRSIILADLPAGTGTVTSFSSGNLSPLFATSVATSTSTPSLSFTLVNQNANLVYAGPLSGGPSAPTFRALSSSDLPSLSSLYWSLSGNSSIGGGFLGTTGSDALVFKTNSTEYARISSTGNFGIAQSNPTIKLQVGNNTSLAGGELASFGTSGINGNTLISIINPTAGTVGQTEFYVASDIASVALATLSSTFITTNGLNIASSSVLRSSSPLNIGTIVSSPITFWTNQAQRAIITSTGSVGINTATPLGTLHVVGFGSTSSTYTTRLQNSGLVDLMAFRDDGGYGNQNITLVDRWSDIRFSGAGQSMGFVRATNRTDAGDSITFEVFNTVLANNSSTGIQVTAGDTGGGSSTGINSIGGAGNNSYGIAGSSGVGASRAYGVFGQAIGGVSGTSAGVVGTTTSTNGFITIGVWGNNESTSANTNYGGYFQSTAVNTGVNIGGFFSATQGGTNYGLLVSGGNIGFGTTTPNTSALLDIVSTTQGVTLPRMTTTQKNAISSPTEGLMVYDLTAHSPYFWNGSSWTAF